MLVPMLSYDTLVGLVIERLANEDYDKLVNRIKRSVADALGRAIRTDRPHCQGTPPCDIESVDNDQSLESSVPANECAAPRLARPAPRDD